MSVIFVIKYLFYINQNLRSNKLFWQHLSTVRNVLQNCFIFWLWNAAWDEIHLEHIFELHNRCWRRSPISSRRVFGFWKWYFLNISSRGFRFLWCFLNISNRLVLPQIGLLKKTIKNNFIFGYILIINPNGHILSNFLTYFFVYSWRLLLYHWK